MQEKVERLWAILPDERYRPGVGRVSGFAALRTEIAVVCTPTPDAGDSPDAEAIRDRSGVVVPPLVGLGASAGGLQALQSFFRHVPPDTGMAFVVIVHLDPEHESRIAEILAHHTSMPTAQVTGPTAIEPNHVYVIPPDHNLTVEEGQLRLQPRRSPGANPAAIDLFLRSLAESHGAAAGGIILSGTGSDGTEGIRHVKERGGVTMAQEPEEAEYGDMPRAAIASGVVDRVARVAELAAELAYVMDGNAPGIAVSDDEEAESPEADSVGMGRVFAELRRATGHDFSGYKPATVLRRLRRRMQFVRAQSIPDYLDVLRRDPDEIKALSRDLLISVTGFFRDPDAFAVLESQAIPEIFAGKTSQDDVRVWVAGCATGEEAFSVAMLLREHADSMDDPPTIHIFATDVNERALSVAREAAYPLTIAADVGDERLARHFNHEPGAFKAKKQLREVVLFASHDLLRDPPFSQLELVVCRNVLIYLQRQLQQQVLETFHYALPPGGFLFLGSSESADLAAKRFTDVDKRHRIFRSRAAPFVLDRGAAARAGAEGQSAAESTTARRSPDDYPSIELHRRLLELYAPPSLVVDARGEVVHLSDRAGKYLRIRGGTPTRNLLDMVEGPVKLELRRLLHSALHGGEADEVADLPMEVEGQPRRVRVAVRPLTGDDGDEGFALVVFDEQPVAPSDGVAEAEERPVPTDSVERLEDELRRTKETLQATIEEFDALVQQLSAANEELQSINEEQRATSEELETSKEELQSVNEELQTVNQERRVKIEELAQVNADLRNLINSTGVATIFLDRNLRIRRFTPTVAGLFNFLESDEGRPVEHVTHHLDYPELVDDARQVLQSLERSEREVLANDGRWFSVRIVPYRSLDDHIDGVVLTFMDTTARKQAETDRQRLLEEARAASEAKSKFIGILSHDFRTPLGAVTGYAGLIAEGASGPVNEKQREQLLRVVAAARQLEGMAEDLLSYTLSETGTSTVNLEDVDACAVARELAGMVELQARLKGLEMRFEVDDEPLPLRTDPEMLRHILTNLLNNAIKFTAKGYVALTVHGGDDEVTFEVEDTGAGIEPEERHRIFERFWQGQPGGTGLGLAIVKEYAELLGGQVEVDSQPGRGSRFRVRLPSSPKAATSVRTRRAPEPQPPRMDLS